MPRSVPRSPAQRRLRKDTAHGRLPVPRHSRGVGIGPRPAPNRGRRGGPHIVAQILPHHLGVPRRPRQQVLRPVRSGITGMLGDCPTVRPRQPGQQTEQERSSPPARFDPAEPRPDQAHQLIEARRPAVGVYAVAASPRGKITIYGWSISWRLASLPRRVDGYVLARPSTPAFVRRGQIAPIARLADPPVCAT
jgi:hypothetical protein